MWFRKYGLAIFTLYMVTSTIFLLVFCFMYFKIATAKFEREVSMELKTAMMEIEMSFRSGGDITNANLDKTDKDIKENIFSLNEKKFIKQEFTPLNLEKIRKKKAISGHIYKDKSDIYYIDKIKPHGRDRMLGNTSSYEVVLKSDGYKKHVDELLLKMATLSMVSFFIFFVISYFIVQLSFRPLLDKINSLNSFITDTTHEINTPLSVILMSIELFDVNPKKYLCNIKTASKTLSMLYDDLVKLNFDSSINKIQKLNLKNLISERAFYFESMASEKGLKFELNLDEVFKETDEVKFSKIIDNLISNATKYSDKNSVIVINLDSNSLIIQNSGEEILKENLDKIYDKFSRFNKSKGGFGIGLSLVKRYCEDLGYKITCTSESKITKFSIKFN
ncbi:sensor histidine kinase [Campylobacter geochelonis]|uniref:histidine kinase n=1 Tax=Campylobacter geochelonis TaxID=1780362 RepID=A0A128EI83_9BACT|nr:HAMP domain-containing sensor histidine kinase [Campylobacter geochelonis]QKF71123.1 two-component system sensor histidine kinase [Campylobacter geochelonis]CZE48281.1 sensor histidine kinase [Campylobacter geochelonis]CZE48936.1 sensor histidine kinase [Campylobacter geochelonis]CZE50056.1 sensor histidine kinase [Campylobacter geochelonis]